jgi:predicted PurR-regulated permease PerM
VIVMALLLVLVPMLAKQLLRLYQLAPQVLDWLQHTAMPWVQSPNSAWPMASGSSTRSRPRSASIWARPPISSGWSCQATASSLALIGFLTNLILIPVVAFYLLRDWDIMLAKIRGLLPRDREERIVSLAGECHDVLGAPLSVGSCW